MTLELVKNPDILGSARSEFGFDGTLIGFAAETENVIENARGKLLRKQCDMVVANDVSRSDIGFNSAQNELMLVTAEDVTTLEKAEKTTLAMELVEIALGIH
jgi:phosphopantothenoylcysteine synthetase/decarboxylase